MAFRKNLFLVLALLALGWIILGVSLTSQSVQEVGATVTNDAQRAGVAIGGGIALTTFLCTGLPLFFLFALLSWRNGVGLRSERRHQETLAAMQVQSK